MIIDKNIYVKAIESLLSDTSKFQKLNVKPDKELKYLINMEIRLRKCLKNLLNKNYINEATYKKLSPVGSNPDIMYGLAKGQKPTKNGVPPFRPILSAIGTPTYNFAKFLVPILSPHTVGEFTVKDSFSFSEEITQQNCQCYMASFDVN